MKIACFLSFTLFLVGSVTHAEIVLDGTLGFKGAIAGPDYRIEADLGQQHGANLFHSFASFNLHTNETATFTGPDTVHRIINRVTGGQASYINGMLQTTIPTADVYLMNPAGVVFGPDAALSLPGAFHVTTADALRLEDGGIFDARQLKSSLLTTAPVESFGFLTTTPAPITFQESQLTVSPGKTLSMVGGNLEMIGNKPTYNFQEKEAIFSSGLTAQSGQINLVSVAGPGRVVLITEDNVPPGGNITLKQVQISTSGEASGFVSIKAGQLTLDNSLVDADSEGVESSRGIQINADELTLSNGGALTSIVFDAGDGGPIDIQVTGTTRLTGANTVHPSGILAFVAEEATGKAGTITLSTQQFDMVEGAAIWAGSDGPGQGGHINIKVAETMSLSGRDKTGELGSHIIALSENEAINAGDAGIIEITAKKLFILEGALISVVTLGPGRGGHIKIHANERIQLEDHSTVSQLSSSGILAISMGKMPQAGQGGTIELSAEEILIAGKTGIAAGTKGTAPGGNIYLSAKQLSLGQGAAILAGTDDIGPGGKIELSVEQLAIQAAIIGVAASDIGSGGHTKIKVNRNLTIKDGVIAALSKGQGNAGQVVLEVGGTLCMEESLIDTQALHSQADGGDINIQVSGPLYLANSGITTTINAKDSSDGNIALKAAFVLLNNSNIIAKTQGTEGGDIDITTRSVIKSPTSQINASGDLSIITAVKDNLSDKGAIFPVIFIDAGKLLKKSCQTQFLENTSHFVFMPLTGRVVSPTDWQSSAMSIN